MAPVWLVHTTDTGQLRHLKIFGSLWTPQLQPLATFPYGKISTANFPPQTLFHIALFALAIPLNDI